MSDASCRAAVLLWGGLAWPGPQRQSSRRPLHQPQADVMTSLSRYDWAIESHSVRLKGLRGRQSGKRDSRI